MLCNIGGILRDVMWLMRLREVVNSNMARDI